MGEEADIKFDECVNAQNTGYVKMAAIVIRSKGFYTKWVDGFGERLTLVCDCRRKVDLQRQKQEKINRSKL